MKVTVTETCSRCKRESQREIDSTEIGSLEQEDQRRAEALETIQEQVAAWPQDDIPELLLYFRGEIRTLDRVCEKHCEKTITNHLGEVFRQIDPTKRKPRRKKKNGDTAVDAASEDASAAVPPASEADEKTADSEVQA